MFYLTPNVYLEQDDMFDIATSRDFGFVDSVFNKVIFDPNNFRLPLFNCDNFEKLKEEQVLNRKLMIYVNDQLYWNILYTTLDHIVKVIFKMDSFYVKELYETYRLKHFSETGNVAPPIEVLDIVAVPPFLLPITFSDCAFELLVYFTKNSGIFPSDVSFNTKITNIMEKWIEDRALSTVSSLIKNYDVFNKQTEEVFSLCSFIIKRQPITRKQYKLLFNTYCNYCGVSAYPSLEQEMIFLLKYLNGEVSIVDCFNFLSDNKIKAFSFERKKINEWVLYKCFVKK